MYACPHCGGPGISVLRKLCLGSGGRVTCRSCGKKLSVPWWAWLASLPLVVGLLATHSFARDLNGFLLHMGGGLIFSLILNILFVPVIRR
jgi:hypothetical protein